jgi:hypothetical protein
MTWPIALIHESNLPTPLVSIVKSSNALEGKLMLAVNVYETVDKQVLVANLVIHLILFITFFHLKY